MNRSEIVKVRVTPAEKENWEQQAAAKDPPMGVSELIRSRMNAHEILPAKVVPIERELWPPSPEWGTDQSPEPINTAAKDVDTSERADRVKKERRTEPCEHGKPVYLYCRVCKA